MNSFALLNSELQLDSKSGNYNHSVTNLKEKKEAWAACAAALARVVFEHPGGPCKSTPRTGDIPSLANAAACLMGHSTA